MIFVIQCAGAKRRDAGCMRQRSGEPVLFVGDPATAPAAPGSVYARPDDPSDDGTTWRDQLLRYNDTPGDNQWNLLPAWRLYRPPAYGRLVKKFGASSVYILSAGWGLIGAEFLTPDYDITFSNSAEPYKRRRPRDRYDDLNMLPTPSSEPIFFFGGKAYISLFDSLTASHSGRRVVFFNSVVPPDVTGCELRRYTTRKKTNWHYDCVNDCVDGRIEMPG